MVQAQDARLRAGLDLLDLRGRRQMSANANRTAALAAFDAMLLTTTVVPAVGLLWSVVRPLALTPFLALTLLVPAAAFAARYWHDRRGAENSSRTRALLFLDRELALKDRLVASDEFLSQADRGRFQLAALAEAETWIEQAQSRLLYRAPARLDHALRRRWPFLAGAVAAVVLALAISRAGGVGVTSDAGPRTRDAVGEVAHVKRAIPPPLPLPTGKFHRPTKAATSSPAPAGDWSGAAFLNPVGAAMAALGAAVRSAITGGGGGESSSKSDGGRAAGGNNGHARGGSPHGGKNSDTRADGMGGTTPPTQAETLQAAVPKADGVEAGDVANSAMAPQGGQAAGAPQGAPSQRSGAPKSGNPMPGQRPQPSESNSDETGKQSGSNPGLSSGNGRNAKRSGDAEGLKKGRGFAGMLLARPMRDQIGGMKSQGGVSVVTSPASVQPASVGQVTAQARGDNDGDVGQVPHRGDGAYENRLARDYFTRQGARR